MDVHLLHERAHLAPTHLITPVPELTPDLAAAVKGILQMDLIHDPHQIHIPLIHRDGLIIITRTTNGQDAALLADRQFMGPVDHFFALDPSIRSSATAKKSFSIVSLPILAWSSLTSGSRGDFFPFSKTSEAFSKRCFLHSVIWLGCTWNRSESSTRVCPSLTASTATLALN